MKHPFENCDWKADINEQGFQSDIYDDNDNVIATVEPTAIDDAFPSHRQICRLIAASPKMYRMLAGLESSVPGEEIGALLSSILFGGFDIVAGRPL